MKKTVLYSVLFIMMIAQNCKDENSNNYCEEGDFSNRLTQEEVTRAHLTPEILWKFGRVSEMQLSPNGTRVIYLVTRYDVKTNKKHSWIYCVPSTGGPAENLTQDIPTCSNPRWLNNHTIVFLCAKDKLTTLWSMKDDGSDKKVISDAQENVGGFEIAPNGRRLFYLSDVKLDSTTQDKYPDLPLAKGIIIDDLMYRHWDSWHDYAYSHIFIADIEKCKVKPGVDIMKGEHFDSPLSPYFDNADIAWNNDGSLLAYTCKKQRGKAYAESTNSDIYLYRVENGTTTNITEGMPGYDRYPVFSPNGKMLAFMSMATPGYEADKERLFIYNLNDQTKKYLTEKLDQNAANFVWSADSRKIFFISGIHATYQIYEAMVDTPQIRQITRGYHDYASLAFNNGVMTGSKSSMSMSPEIFRIDIETGKETQLTFTNKNIYNAIKFGTVKQTWVKTSDNRNMLVWMIFPPDFDSTKKYPAILFCQGGPQSAVSQSFSFRWNFQLMAANEYIIIAPNRRGLPTFGQEWNAQISGDYGGQNIKDYLSAVDAVKGEPYINGDRIGAVGASYGGYSVLYLAGCHEKRFKVFLSHCGMFNLESQSAGTEEMFFVHHDLRGYYWDKPKSDSYTLFSPHLHVDKWDTPIMLVTGMNDFRIPYTESLQAFNVAQLRGIPSKLLVFPDENHWVLKPQNSILWQREYFGWLNRYLKQ